MLSWRLVDEGPDCRHSPKSACVSVRENLVGENLSKLRRIVSNAELILDRQPETMPHLATQLTPTHIFVILALGVPFSNRP